MSESETAARYGSMYSASLASVPEEVFTPGYRGTITTPSGRQLDCLVDENYVGIQDPSEVISPGRRPNSLGDPTYRFTAAVAKMYGVLAVSFYVRNRNPLSDRPYDRHPDIHPMALGARALDYFESTGRIVQGMKDLWQATRDGLPIAADNWQQFTDNLGEPKAAHGRYTARQKRTAAYGTTSGRFALRLGFNQVGFIKMSDAGQTVDCLFLRPED